MSSKPFYEKTELESDLQAQIIEFMHIRGWFAQKVEFKGRTGGMDVVGVRQFRTVWVEVKRENEVLRLKQEKVAREMRAKGAEVYMIDNMQDARRLLR